MNKSYRKETALAATILVGLVAGCFWAGSKLAIWDSIKKMWPDPWFKITVFDLYTGFGLFGIFIMHREKSIVKSSIWMVLMAGLGNIASLLYLILEITTLRPGKRVWEAKHDTWRLF